VKSRRDDPGLSFTQETSVSKDYAQIRRRIRAAFPSIASAGDDILSLADFLDRRPERYFSQGAAAAMFDALVSLRREDPDLLIQFFAGEHEALKTAFRSMDDINRLRVHDYTLNDLGANDVHQLAAIDQVVHPAYLRLTEAVLGVALIPVARSERRKRSKNEDQLALTARIDEARNGTLGPYLVPFNRIVRNAIAHGGIVFRDTDIEYRDAKHSVEHSVSSILRLFDEAVDVCNGLLLGYRQFFVAHSDFLAAHRLTPPLPVVLSEIQAQVNTDVWRIVGGLESAYAHEERGLRLLAEASVDDQLTVYEAIAVTGALAERLAPEFDVYEISCNAFGMAKGVGFARGSRLREAREQGVTAPLQIAMFFEGPILVYPKIIEQSVRVAPDDAHLGTSVIREARLVRKADWLQLDATIVLESDDRQWARSYIRSEIRPLVATAVALARQASTDVDIQKLPIGATYVDVFLRDVRRRDFYGLGSNRLCRIVERAKGAIQDWPLHKSDIEFRGRIRFEWNTAPFGEDGLAIEAK
jgi:hypothetical protein